MQIMAATLSWPAFTALQEVDIAAEVHIRGIGSSSTISVWEPRRIGGPQMPVPVETFRKTPAFPCRPFRYG